MTTSCRKFFVNREWPALFSVKCETAILVFLLKRDVIFQNDYPWNENWVLNALWTVIWVCFFHIFLVPTCDQAAVLDPKLKPVCLWVSFPFTTTFIYHDGNCPLTFSILFRLASRLPSIGQISFGSVVSAIHFVVSLTQLSLSAVYFGSLCRSGQMMAMRMVMPS